jgi:hypothetical protein
MKITAQTLFALGFIGAIAVSIPAPVKAQGVSIYGPGVEVDIGARRYPYRSYNRGYDAYGYYPYRPPGTARQVDPYGTTCYRGRCCPPGYSVQDGVCKPYRGY